MREEELAGRLSKLQSSLSSVGRPTQASETKGIQERLQALYAKGGEPLTEGDFNTRLAALTGGKGDESTTCPESLKSRLERLSTTGVRDTSSIELKYSVPEDLDDDWEDLDDLLEGALLERQKDGGINEHGVSGAQSAEKTAVDRDARLDSKLSDIDRLLTSEAASVAASSEASTAAAFEIAGVGANEAMDTFLAGGEMGRGGAGGKSSASVPGDFLGDEEEQLMQMVTDELRLEGQGHIAHTTAPESEKVGDLWLPIAPTAPPVVRPAGGRIADTADPDVGAEARARLLAQQAMDEARLGLGNDGKSATSGDIRAGYGSKQQQQQQPGEDLASSWCCVCSEDAAVRCRDCEKENEGNEPELFCARCFNDVHRGDPDMESHRPQPFSGREGAKILKHSGRRRVFGWRRT